MKLILSLVAFCLALNNGMGVPTARYKFVRCKPSGGQANCDTYEGPLMEFSPDLPSKLPASAAEYIEGKPVMEEDEGESPVKTSMDQPEEGSGGYEGSAGESPSMADWPFPVGGRDTGSGEFWTEDLTEQNGMRGNEDARKEERSEWV